MRSWSIQSLIIRGMWHPTVWDYPPCICLTPEGTLSSVDLQIITAFCGTPWIDLHGKPVSIPIFSTKQIYTGKTDFLNWIPSKAHLPKRVKTWNSRAILPPRNNTWFPQAAMAKMVHRTGCARNFTYQSETSMELRKYTSKWQNCHLVNFHVHQLTKIPEMCDV